MVRIMGVDPGSRITGYGVVEQDGSGWRLIASGVLRVVDDDIGIRLRRIYEGLSAVIVEHQPREFAIEKVFVQHNVVSALKLGQARGVAICAAAVHDLPVFEYAPNQIKQAVVGAGHADKQQVQWMMKLMLRLTTLPVADEADAIACGICHGHYQGHGQRTTARGVLAQARRGRR